MPPKSFQGGNENLQRSEQAHSLISWLCCSILHLRVRHILVLQCKPAYKLLNLKPVSLLPFLSFHVMYPTGDSVSSVYPNTEKRVENMTCSGVFLTKFKVFG